LREAAKGELLALALPAVKRHAIAIKRDADSLYDEVDLPVGSFNKPGYVTIGEGKGKYPPAKPHKR
jgi:hypothetical protein